MKCKICNQEIKDLRALSTHIQFKHENKSQEYYDSYMMKEKEGSCKVCGNPTKYTGFQKGYSTYCSKPCMKLDYSERKRLDNPMSKQSAKDNQRKTNQERYGVNSTMQLKAVLDKRVESNMEKYGVENIIQIKEVMDKANKSRSETCMKEHGVPHYFMVPEVQKKIENTCIKKYGSKTVLSSKYGIKKSKETCFKKYGVEYPTQNKEIFEKAQKSSGHAHQFNKNLYYRGSYELDFLEKYYGKFEIKQGLIFDYHFNSKDRKYFSDFYLPEFNLIVEIKNSYAAQKYKEIINAKKEAVLASNYNFIMVLNKDYKEFEYFLKSFL